MSLIYFYIDRKKQILMLTIHKKICKNLHSFFFFIILSLSLSNLILENQFSRERSQIIGGTVAQKLLTIIPFSSILAKFLIFFKSLGSTFKTFFYFNTFLTELALFFPLCTLDTLSLFLWFFLDFLITLCLNTRVSLLRLMDSF